MKRGRTFPACAVSHTANQNLAFLLSENREANEREAIGKTGSPYVLCR